MDGKMQGARPIIQRDLFSWSCTRKSRHNQRLERKRIAFRQCFSQ